MKRKDIYKVWVEDKTLESKLKLIKELASKSCGMEIIASILGISETTLYTLRKKYQDVDEAYVTGRNLLKQSLLEMMFKKAMGFQIIDEDTYIEQTSSGTKKKILKKMRNVLPDPGVGRYLLIINFGKEYSEKKYELELSEKKAEIKNNESEWRPLEVGDIDAANKKNDK
ncbi:MAG: hypothetical protein FWE36_00305 [Erysipelotrichales bacterium]|nr:hypothetical protein [Erysipelotrichales bacterium]